jgi:hypothetical protein
MVVQRYFVVTIMCNNHQNLVQPHRVWIKEGSVMRQKSAGSVDFSCYLYLFNDSNLHQNTLFSVFSQF